MARLYDAMFNRFSLRLRKDTVMDCAHQGRCDDDVAAAVDLPYIARQFAAIPAEDIAAELKEYGAWDAEELADDAANRERALWLARTDIREERRW